MELNRNHKKLIHGICFHHIFFSSPEKKMNSLKPEAQDNTILLKYFPKHITNLHFKFSDGSLNTRIKSLKLVKKLTCEKNPRTNFWRLVVANKRKTVQSFKKEESYWDQQYTKLNVEFFKMFSNTRRVEFCPPYSKELHKKGFYWARRAFCYLNNLNSLEYLKLTLQEQNPFQLLLRLKHSQRILSHLKEFAIDLSLLDSEDLRLLPKFLTYKEILKHLTMLYPHKLTYKESFEAFQRLPEYCPRLSFLCFDVSQGPSQEETNYFRSLKNFNNLKEFRLNSYHGLDLLKNCTFPKSIHCLELSFTEIDWEKFIDSPSSLVAFDDQPENLMNLQTLILSFDDMSKNQEQFSPHHHRAIEIFLQDLLKKIPTCKELNLTLSYPYSYDHIFKASPFIFDFSGFLESIRHFSQSLEVLDISDKSRDYHFVDIKIQSVAFPRLSRLSISTEFSPFVEFGDIINVVQVQGSNSLVRLEGIKVESCEILLKLMRRLGEMNVGKRVEFTMYCEDLEADKLYFEENYEDVKSKIGKVENLFLIIKIQKSNLTFRRELESFQPSFGNLKVEFY